MPKQQKQDVTCANFPTIKTRSAFSKAIASFISGAAMLTFATSAFAQQPLKDITVGLASASLTAGSVRVAKEMGLFEKYGLNPKFVPMETGNAAITGLIGGSFEAVVATTGDLLAAATRGQKIVAIASVYDGLAATLVLSKSVADKLKVSPTAPAAERFKALEGVLIALPGATGNATLAFKTALQVMNVNPKIVYVTNPNMPAALQSGSVEAFFTSSPFWAQPTLNGSAVVWLSGPRGDFPPQTTPATGATLQVSRAYAESNPDVVAALVKANLDFGKAIVERPSEVRAAMAKAFPQVEGSVLDLFITHEAASWNTKPFTRDVMIREINFVKGSGLPLAEIEALDPASLVYTVK